MRKIIVSTYTTLDGVIQPIDWSMQSHDPASAEERGAYARDLLFEADALLLGRETFEIFADVWPTRTAADDDPGADGATDRINSMPKYVVSTTLTSASAWRNSTLIKDNVIEEVRALKAQPGKNISIDGSSVLVHALAQHDLVDEYSLLVYPVVLGGGKKLFPEGARRNLRLIDSHAFPSGVVLLRYEADPHLRQIYLMSLQRSWQIERPERCPLFNVIYGALTGEPCDAEATVETLREIPLDLVHWDVRNSHRPDVARHPDPGRFGEAQSAIPLPFGERPMMKWNGNPFRLDGGDGGRTEEDGAFFLLPYWLGRYHGIIEEREG